MSRERWWWPTYLARKAQYVASKCGGFYFLVLYAVVSIFYFIFRDFAVFRRNFGHNFSHFWAFRAILDHFYPFLALVPAHLLWFGDPCGGFELFVVWCSIRRFLGANLCSFGLFFGSFGPFLPFLGAFSGSLAVVWWSMLVILLKLDMNSYRNSSSQ